MKSVKVLRNFGLKFFGLYFLLFLVAHFSGLDNGLRKFYASTGTNLFKNISSKAEINGLVYEDKEKGTNVLFQVHNKKRLDEIRREMVRTGKTNVNVETLGIYSSSRTTLLMPLIFLISLILAYPSDFRRKIISLIAGIVLFLTYAFFKLGCSLIHSIDESQEYFPDYELSGFLSKFLAVVAGLIVDGAYVVVALIWFLVCVRISDFKLD